MAFTCPEKTVIYWEDAAVMHPDNFQSAEKCLAILL